MLSPNTLMYSPAGDVTGELVYCGLGGSSAAFPPAVAGNIALILRGAYTFQLKVANAAAVGAVGAVSISQAEGNYLLTRLLTPPVTAHLVVDTIMYAGTSRNVIGTLKGLKPQDGTVYMGAHYDSVSAGPGANDDASGVGALLEAARVLTDKGHRARADLTFIAFGAEEVGLVGSFKYVTANYPDITTRGLGMINLDMVGVGGTRRLGNIGWAPPALTDYAGLTATRMGLPWVPFTAGANSDHAYFEQAGLPVVFVQQSPDPNYHTADDTPDKIDVAALEANGELATATAYGWAKNPVHRTAKAAHFEQLNVFQDRVVPGR